MNVPKLRFYGYDDLYKNVKLSTFAQKIFSKNKGNTITNVISNSAIYGLISQRDFFDKDIANNDNTENYYIIEHGDFVYNPRKSNEAPYGPINLYKYEDAGVISPLYLCFRTKNINRNYLEYYFKSPFWYRYIYLNGDSGARHDRVSIKDETFFNMNINIPCLEEQTKVSDFLSLLDKKIELQSKKIEDLKLFKLCIMKSIFNSSKASINLKIKDISLIEKGKQINGDQLLEFGDYYMLNGGINPSGYLNVYNRNENTITISEGGNSCGYVSFNKNKFWCGGHCYSVSPININNEYLYQLLKYNERKIMDLRVGSGLPNIQKKDLENLSIKIHNNSDQENISILLSKYDSKIDLEIIKLNILNKIKKGLIQNLFV